MLLRAAILFFLALPAGAIELEIRFSLLERQLSEQLFTQDGRRYVRGNPTTKCNYAFLASPKFSSRDGKLLIQARFTGRSSLDIFGKCVGFGDSFDLEILSALATKDGSLRLNKPEVRILSRDTFYTRQVLKALRSSVVDAINYPIRDEIRKIFEAGVSSTVYQVKIIRLEIRDIQVLENALVVDVDTRLKVDPITSPPVSPTGSAASAPPSEIPPAVPGH